MNELLSILYLILLRTKVISLKKKVEMIEIIVTSVAANFATAFSKFNFTPPSTPIINNRSISIDPSKTFFKAEELGLFDPEFPIEYGPGDVVRISKNTIYRSIHLFVQRITDIASIKGDKIISYNLPLYLRETALEWYSGLLTVPKKESLRANIKNWIETFRRRFKTNPTTALDKI